MPELPSITRRRFTQLLGASAAAVVARPGLALSESTLARRPPGLAAAAAAVRLNSNENPYGPSPMAVKAMSDAFSLAWRYPDEHADQLIATLARINGVEENQILLGDGSGEILKLCAAAFTGPMANGVGSQALAKPTRGNEMTFVPGRGKLIVADPTFEAILNHARVNGAEVLKLPLTSSYSHDLPGMLAAANEGLIYVCNPNNPTASLTPKNEVREFINRVPPGTMILVDEAYFHYADSSDFESVIPMIKAHPNLIVARTFSKIYGMAGLRCGYCVAQTETIQRLRPHQVWDSVNIMALVAAKASLNDPDQVTKGRRMNSETKTFVIAELDRMGLKHIPSQANFLMIDMKRPVRPLIDALNRRGVQVGRVFPTLPNHMRVTVGKAAEMEAFLSAFGHVVSEAV